MTWWNVGQTGNVPYPPGGRAVSADNGQTWTADTSGTTIYSCRHIRPPGQSSYGFAPYHSNSTPFTSFSEIRARSLDGGISWSSAGPATYDLSPVSYTYVVRNHGNIIVDGEVWLLTCYGKRTGARTHELILFASTDTGVNWIRRSTIASHVGDWETAMGTEGPNEGNIVRLNNGNLLAIYRTGQAFPTCDLYEVHPSMCWSISTDKGHTWSAPKMLGAAANQPNIFKLNDGSVVLTYGRYGGKLIFADETGTRWSDPFVVNDQPGCGSVRMVPTDDGKYVFIYNISSFYNPSHDPNPPACYVYEEGGEEVAHLKAAILDIQRIDVVDEFDWAVEYHGDVALDTMSEAWAVTKSGRISRIGYDGDVWPDSSTPPWIPSGDSLFSLGVDDGAGYLNINTDVGGGGFGYVTLTGAIPDIVNDGVVIQSRMRVRDDSRQCGGISFGDGNLGGVFRFYCDATHNQVSIRRSSGGLVYPAIPAPDPAQWHVYKVVASGSTWELFCDDVSIFADSMVAAGDSVQFGDATGSGNDCNVDYDYVRITPGTSWDLKPLLWADNGRDYCRFDTGKDDESRCLYYTLSGIDSSWGDMDFTTGVVTDVRARVAATTGEGAANIFLGDGGNGYVVVELTGAGVNLEGAGGDAAEVSYGFDTSDWHAYRLVVAPDPTQGDALRAKLYLDEDYSAPILVSALNAGTSDDEIRIGDMAGKENGILDLDFLRFASPVGANN